MFASALSSAVSQHSARAYTQVHVATGVNNASAHGLIGLLFDALLGAVAEARGAIRTRNVAAKGRAIGHALRIVDEGLAAALNTSEGGRLATDLQSLYSYIGVRLTFANLHNDESALEECTRLIEPLKSGWAGIGAQVDA